MRTLRHVAVAALAVLAACSATAPGPTTDHRVAEHVRTWGGSEEQYRSIFALRDCDQLEGMMTSTAEAIDGLPLGSDEQRAQIGYSQAILARLTDLDC